MSMQHRPKCRALVPSKLFNFKTISKAKKPQIFRLEALYLSVAGTREMSNFLEDVQAVANWR